MVQENIKLNFVIICESVIVDKETNNLSFLNIFENIIASGVPAIHPKFTIITKFEGGVGEHNHKIIISHESIGGVGTLSGKINFGENQKTQYIGRFVGFTFPKFGKYMIEIYVDSHLQPLKGSLEVIKKK